MSARLAPARLFALVLQFASIAPLSFLPLAAAAVRDAGAAETSHSGPLSPATIAPELASWSVSRGITTTRWQLHQGPGPTFEPPVLQRRLPALGWSDVAQASARDTLAGTVDFLDQNNPGEEVTWRLRWLEGSTERTSDTILVSMPPPPVDMASNVDSALVYGGAAHLQWTLADDSLSYLMAPVVSRWDAVAGWIGVASVWPDSLRRVRFVDPSIAGGTTYRYQLRWLSGVQSCSTGGWDMTITSPIPVLAERRQPGLGTYARWTVPGIEPFTAIVQRRVGAGGWVRFDTLDADGARDIVVAERALDMGTSLDYRLEWNDGGAWAVTPEEHFLIPRFSATATSTVVGTHRVEITWSFTPVDSLLIQFILRGDGSDVRYPSRFRIPSGSPTFTYVDTTAVPGRSYTYYATAVQTYVEIWGGGGTPITVPAEPAFNSLQAGAGVALLWWTPSTAATAYQVWRAVNGGAFENIGDLPASTQSFSLVDDYPAGAETLSYRLLWFEADGRWRSLRDTTVSVGSNPPPIPATFAIVSANPATDGVTLSYSLPDDRAAKLIVFDLNGRLRLSRAEQGSGARTWNIPRGAVPPGIYWVRFEHPALSRTIRVAVLR